jgi:hypothetical protein
MRTVERRHMPRDRNPRFVLALAVLLVALQFIGVLAPASAGTPPMARESSTSMVIADHADEFATCGDVGQIVDPASWLAGRDRHRPVAEPDAKTPVGGTQGYESTAPPPGSLTASHLASRASATNSLAALQVLRC